MQDPTIVHEQYSEMVEVWQTCGDAAAGQRAIRAGGEMYLPSLTGQSQEDYRAYLRRGSYFNATGRTVAGMCGLVFRKDPLVENVPDDWQADITLTGKSLDGLARDTMRAVLIQARYGWLVDYPAAEEPKAGTKRTKQQVQALGLRAYVTPYAAERITYWEHSRIGNATKLTTVLLMEDYRDEKGDKKVQYRELSLADGSYLINIWREGKVDNKPGWVVVQTFIPRKNGQTLQDIPFIFHGPEETSGDVCESPIEDLANVNISHFCNSCDLENGAHVSGLPTPIIIGADGHDQNGNPTAIQLGTGTAIMLPMGADAKFLEVAQGFETLEKLMDAKEKRMALLGARIIAPEKREAETAETTQTKKGAESSVLADIARAVSTSITKALRFMALWEGVTDKIKYELNRDYLVVVLTAQELTAYVAAVQSGRMSDETFFDILQKREVYPQGLTFEQEKARREESEPPLGTIGREANDGE